MLIVTKKFIFSVGEVWFDENPEELSNVDVVHYRQLLHPIKGGQSDEFYTRLIDLTKSHDELWECISSNDRYKIRRAEQKDHIIYEYWEKIDSDTLNDFSDFYDSFASQKGLTKINRAQLQNRADAGVIDISRVKLKDGESLVWHVYYRTKNRVRLLHSASLKKNDDTSYQSILGRANRYHHWQDIVRFKNLGISTYDFGGWYIGNTDREKLGINQFKEKFGGEVVKNFNCVYGITLKGKLYLHLLNVYMRLSQLSLLRKPYFLSHTQTQEKIEAPASSEVEFSIPEAQRE
ncbi:MULTISPECIES: hypothetical protein [Nostoc]|uniref:BioF2-like acetyltransferase domain-containing protein n=1 Tax=Nostoc paludosum FACHB-159 TaxID=2692908 RepID=A0ABR8K247_9NOSO|nr:MULTISPECIES: hypothetical protein [Nostoc]MBD2678364.1 hypothetical protein [Nostoc sp. FACHB-857]MBD2733483.1 hypothetical protein [Nostoc paludosum FACHB-159]